jgi:Ca2+-binding EF-hand superfamily protein
MNLLFDVLDVNGKGKISLDDLKLANNKYSNLNYINFFTIEIGLTE